MIRPKKKVVLKLKITVIQYGPLVQKVLKLKQLLLVFRSANIQLLIDVGSQFWLLHSFLLEVSLFYNSLYRSRESFYSYQLILLQWNCGLVQVWQILLWMFNNYFTLSNHVGVIKKCWRQGSVLAQQKGCKYHPVTVCINENRLCQTALKINVSGASLRRMFTNIGRFPLDNLQMFGTKLKIWILFGLAHSVNTRDFVYLGWVSGRDKFFFIGEDRHIFGKCIMAEAAHWPSNAPEIKVSIVNTFFSSRVIQVTSLILWSCRTMKISFQLR